MEEFPLPKGGGLIEGRGPENHILSLYPHFHCRKAVASLKDGIPEGRPEGCSNFHCRKAVASLKVQLSVKHLLHDPLFPLPKGGGLIEGKSRKSCQSSAIHISIAERRWPH